MKLLDVKQLCIDICGNGKRFPVVGNVSYSVKHGEILAVVGESGCGKSISSLALARLLDEKTAIIKAEHILLNFGNETIDILNASKKELRRIRGGGIGYIFQEPAVSLNPVFTIGAQIIENLKLHRKDLKDFNAEAIKLLKSVGISDAEARLKAYPHELSGGMQQRIIIAMALAGNPQLLVADEPTTALDVTVQAQILELIYKLCKEKQLGVILITHNLGIVARLADKLAVMYAGNIVEKGDAQHILKHHAHPYTHKLLESVPRLGEEKEYLPTIEGSVPSPENYPAGCRFQDRCERCKSLGEKAIKLCSSQIPPEKELANGHSVACFFPYITEETE